MQTSKEGRQSSDKAVYTLVRVLARLSERTCASEADYALCQLLAENVRLALTALVHPSTTLATTLGNPVPSLNSTIKITPPISVIEPITALQTQVDEVTEFVLTPSAPIQRTIKPTEEQGTLLLVGDDSPRQEELIALIKLQGFNSQVLTDPSVLLLTLQQQHFHGIVVGAVADQVGLLTALETVKQDKEASKIAIFLLPSAELKNFVRHDPEVVCVADFEQAEHMIQAVNELTSLVLRPINKILLLQDSIALRAQLETLIDEAQFSFQIDILSLAQLNQSANEPYDAVMLDFDSYGLAGVGLLKSLILNGNTLFPLALIQLGQKIKLEYARALQHCMTEAPIMDAALAGADVRKLTAFLANLERRTLRKNLMRTGQPDCSLLIVDDNKQQLLEIAKGLTNNDWQLVLADSGQEALQKIEEGLKPSLIIVDLIMPNLDGCKLISIIRRDPQLTYCPIIALASNNPVLESQKSLAVGANSCLNKPVNFSQLIIEIEQLLHQSQRIWSLQ